MSSVYQFRKILEASLLDCLIKIIWLLCNHVKQQELNHRLGKHFLFFLRECQFLVYVHVIAARRLRYCRFGGEAFKGTCEGSRMNVERASILPHYGRLVGTSRQCSSLQFHSPFSSSVPTTTNRVGGSHVLCSSHFIRNSNSSSSSLSVYLPLSVKFLFNCLLQIAIWRKIEELVRSH